MDVKTILLTHAKKYPLMEPTDAVKLLYQNEFGGGHLIRDPEACLDYLRREYRSIPQTPLSPLTESIGNGMARVSLSALDHHGFLPEDLGAVFLQSAAIVHGCVDSFRKKLSVLEEVTCAGQMPFSQEMLQTYLEQYQAKGFPMVSHSEIYRSAYHPAYRIVCTALLPERFRQAP